MARVIVLFERPFHLSREEAAAWVRREATQVAETAGVRSVELTELESASLRWSRVWDWLVEIHLEAEMDGGRLVGESPCTDLLTDLQMLGMQPVVAVADPSRTTLLDGAP